MAFGFAGGQTDSSAKSATETSVNWGTTNKVSSFSSAELVLYLFFLVFCVRHKAIYLG